MFGTTEVDKSLTASQKSKLTAEKPDPSLDKKNLTMSGHSSASSIVNVSREPNITADSSVKKLPTHQSEFVSLKLI